MSFIPEQPKNSVDIVYFDDVKSVDGWKGQTTTKDIRRLTNEVIESLVRLGGIVIGIQRGTFKIQSKDREGFRLNYAVHASDGSLVPGQLDIAALPVKDKWNDKKKQQSLKMSLFMLRDALDGTWFLQQLSPGYSALMPWMLTDNGQTISERWAESQVMNRLLPPGESEFVDGEIINNA